MIPDEDFDEVINKAVEAGDLEHAKDIEGLTLSEEGQKELREQARKEGWDLLHDLMLKDFLVTSDGFYLRRDPGHIGYDAFVGKPNLNETVIGRMRKEIEELSPATRFEVMVKLATKFPDVAEKLDDLYVKYKRLKA